MGLDDMAKINASIPGVGPFGTTGPHRVDFETYGTIAFNADQMVRLIGFGVPVYDGIEFIGFDCNRNPTKLELGVWLQFVPECYREVLMPGLYAVSEPMINEQIRGRHGEVTVRLFVARLRAWIAVNIEPA